MEQKSASSAGRICATVAPRSVTSLESLAENSSFKRSSFQGAEQMNPARFSSNPMSFVNQEGYADKLRKLLSLSASGVLLAKLSAWMESARNKECAG